MFIKTIHNDQIHVINITNINTIDKLRQAIEKAYPNAGLQQKGYAMRVASFHGWQKITQDAHIPMLVANGAYNKTKVYVVQSEEGKKQKELQLQFNIQKEQKEKEVKVEMQENQNNEDKQINNSISLSSILHVAQQHDVNQLQSDAVNVKNIAQVSPDSLPIQQIQPLYTCSLCNVQVVDGPFYRCSVCSDIDLCPVCQSLSQHDHPFIKIKNAQYAKVKIFAILPNQIDHNNNQINPNEGNVQIQQEVKAQHKHEHKYEHQQQQQGVKIVQNNENKNKKTGIFKKLNQIKNYYLGGLFGFCERKDEVIIDNNLQQQNKQHHHRPKHQRQHQHQHQHQKQPVSEMYPKYETNQHPHHSQAQKQKQQYHEHEHKDKHQNSQQQLVSNNISVQKAAEYNMQEINDNENQHSNQNHQHKQKQKQKVKRVHRIFKNQAK